MARDRRQSVSGALDILKNRPTTNGLSAEQGRRRELGREDWQSENESVPQAQDELHQVAASLGSMSPGSAAYHSARVASLGSMSPGTSAAAKLHGERPETWEDILVRSTIQSRGYGGGKKSDPGSPQTQALGRTGSGPDEDANPLLNGADVAEDDLCETPRSKTDSLETELNPVVLSSCPKPLRTHVQNLPAREGGDIETSTPTNVRVSPTGHGMGRHQEAGTMDDELACPFRGPAQGAITIASPDSAASAGQSLTRDPANDKFNFSILGSPLVPTPTAVTTNLSDMGRSIVDEVRASFEKMIFAEHSSPLPIPAAGVSPSTGVVAAKLSNLSPVSRSPSLRDSWHMRGSMGSAADEALLRELDAGARCTRARACHTRIDASVIFHPSDDDCAAFCLSPPSCARPRLRGDEAASLADECTH